MSRENLELVARAYDAFARGGLDPYFEFFDSGMDYRAIEGALDDAGVLHGRDAYRKYCEEWIQTFDELLVEPEELIDAGDRVVVVVHSHARMKASPTEVEMRFGLVWTVRQGKIVRGREYATREEALDAAGLSASAAAGSE